MKNVSSLLAIFIGMLISCTNQSNNNQLNNKPHMQWWKDARFGLFVHWGPVTLTGREISWSRESTGTALYDSLYRRFNPLEFDPSEWIRVAKAAGMKYIVFTAKHHDGFCNWNTKTTGYNIMNSPYGKDICKEIADAAHKEGMPLGWYFSTPDWKDPDCRDSTKYKVFEKRILDQIGELLSEYGEIDLLWADYDGWAPPVDPSKIFSMAKKLQPGIVVNNRLDAFHTDESHSLIGPYGEYATPEQFVAGYGAVPWETCMTLGHQWSWRWNDKPKELEAVTAVLMRCIGGNGNLLLNVGPDSLGRFPDDFTARLSELGGWIREREQTIYKTRGGPYLPAGEYVCSSSGNDLYLHIFPSLKDTILLPPYPGKIVAASTINGKSVEINNEEDFLRIILPGDLKEKGISTLVINTGGRVSNIGPIRPFSVSGSMAYGAEASASGSVGQFLHDPSAAFDDNSGTCWKPGRIKDADPSEWIGSNIHYRGAEIKKFYSKSGWLEADLGKEREVSKLFIQEFVFLKSEIREFNVEYLNKNGKWEVLASGSKMGKWSFTFDPVKTKKLKLNIIDSDGFFGISEFQVF